MESAQLRSTTDHQEQNTQEDNHNILEIMNLLAEEGTHAQWATFFHSYGSLIKDACANALDNQIWLEDAIQETLIAIHRDLPNFTPHSPAQAASWLKTVARNVALRIRRTEASRQRREQKHGQEQNTRKSAIHKPEENEHIRRMQRYLKQLPPKQRQVLELRYIHGMSYQEIQKTLTPKIANVRDVAFRGLQTLRERFLGSLSTGKTESALFIFLAGHYSLECADSQQAPNPLSSLAIDNDQLPLQEYQSSYLAPVNKKLFALFVGLFASVALVISSEAIASSETISSDLNSEHKILPSQNSSDWLITTEHGQIEWLQKNEQHRNHTLCVHEKFKTNNANQTDIIPSKHSKITVREHTTISRPQSNILFCHEGNVTIQTTQPITVQTPHTTFHIKKNAKAHLLVKKIASRLDVVEGSIAHQEEWIQKGETVSYNPQTQTATKFTSPQRELKQYKSMILFRDAAASYNYGELYTTSFVKGRYTQKVSKKKDIKNEQLIEMLTKAQSQLSKKINDVSWSTISKDLENKGVSLTPHKQYSTGMMHISNELFSHGEGIAISFTLEQATANIHSTRVMLSPNNLDSQLDIHKIRILHLNRHSSEKVPELIDNKNNKVTYWRLPVGQQFDGTYTYEHCVSLNGILIQPRLIHMRTPIWSLAHKGKAIILKDASIRRWQYPLQEKDLL